jgi:hypothetical protein
LFSSDPTVSHMPNVLLCDVRHSDAFAAAFEATSHGDRVKTHIPMRNEGTRPAFACLKIVGIFWYSKYEAATFEGRELEETSLDKITLVPTRKKTEGRH